MNPEQPSPGPSNESKPSAAVPRHDRAEPGQDKAESKNDRQRSPEDQPPQTGLENSTNHPPHEDSDLSPAEQEEKEKVRQEVQSALESLHTALKTQDRPSNSQITTAIDQTYLQQLTTPFKRQLVSTIEFHQLQTKDQEAFVKQGMTVLDFWIHLQGLKRGTNRDLEELRTNLKAE